jgi:hypothetical protein
MTFSLPPTLYSPRQVDAYQVELDAYLEWLRESERKSRGGGNVSAGRSPLSAEVLQVLDQFSEGRPTAIAQVERFIGWLKAIKQSTPLVHVTLPTFAGADMKQKIVGWFRENIAPNVLVSFSVDRTILGGLIIRTANQIYDFSFVRALLDNRSKLPEIVRRV